MSDKDIGIQAARKLQQQLFADEARFRDLQMQSVNSATRLLLMVNGGVAVSLATWIQSSLAADASTQQQCLAPYLLTAMCFCLFGLVCAALMPFATHRNIAHALTATSSILQRTIKPALGEKSNQEYDTTHRDAANQSASHSETWHTMWIVLYGLSWLGFVVSVIIVLVGGFRAVSL